MIFGYCCYFYFQFKSQSTAPETPDEETGSTPDEETGSTQEIKPNYAELTGLVAVISLILITVLISFHSDFLISSLDVVSTSVPDRFVGLILIPIIRNAAEH